MTDAVILERRGALAHIRLNRPERLNAIDQPLADALLGAVHDIQADQGVRAVLLTGEGGRGFMAGGDVTTFGAPDAPAQIERLIGTMHTVILALTSMPVPVVAAVHGAIAGGGLGVMLAADVVLAASNARFVMAYGRLGTTPDCGCSWILPRLLGLHRALAFSLLEEALDAEAARDVGLVARVVSADSLAAEAMAMAERLAAGPTRALGRAKALMRAASGRDLPAQLDAERDSFVACAREPDFAEGVRAFSERRSPTFRGA